MVNNFCIALLAIFLVGCHGTVKEVRIPVAVTPDKIVREQRPVMVADRSQDNGIFVQSLEIDKVNLMSYARGLERLIDSVNQSIDLINSKHQAAKPEEK